ncbi:MAG: ribosomal-protein-alanine N-acetyltransferase [Thiotrichales bacterium]|nr:MAG: ribosomal-protein-alanine N-acetyltransferase [Thiotrichales bacterium]
MSQELHFKLLEVSDLTDIMEIERQTAKSPWSASMMRDSLRAAHNRVWGVFESVEEKQLIGYAVVSVVIDEAEVLSININNNLQHKGYGKHLVSFVIKQMMVHKVQNVFAYVRVSNKPAKSLFEKFGFKQISTREKYYPANKTAVSEDAIVFGLDISDVAVIY